VSGPFIDYIRDVMEKVISMKATLEREKRAKAAEWKQRETEIDGIAYNLAEMYGGLQGIGARLPNVPDLELPVHHRHHRRVGQRLRPSRVEHIEDLPH
jgi:hypothetical protein